MDISFLNEQDKFDITDKLKELITLAAKTALDYMGFDRDAEISVMFTDNEGIRVLNAQHRGIDRATDVLSFPMLEYDDDGEMFDDPGDIEDELCLGDIVISLERAAEQAEEYGHSFEREVGFLTVHSMLHLLGYDHMEPEEAAVMEAKQAKALEELGITR